jgi:hypothetical protein
MAASAAPALPASDERADRAFAAWFAALPADPALIRFFDRTKVGLQCAGDARGGWSVGWSRTRAPRRR